MATYVRRSGGPTEQLSRQSRLIVGTKQGELIYLDFTLTGIVLLGSSVCRDHSYYAVRTYICIYKQ